MKIQKGALVKYKKRPYLTYNIYRIKEADNKIITLIPALHYINNGMIKIPIQFLEIPELFSFLTTDEIAEFEKKEFKNACYQACVDVDRLIDKLEQLDKYTDSHRINGEISSLLIQIKQKMKRLGG